MKNVELPRTLSDYFAHAELERQGDTRRFSITLPYLGGPQLGRLQWWWRLEPAEESLLGESAALTKRQKEIERFERHVERWLVNTRQRFIGDGPIPLIEAQPSQAEAAPAPAEAEKPDSNEIDERRYA